MTKFNICDYRVSTHYTEITDQQKANKALQPLIDLLQRNNCLDLAVKLLEGSKEQGEDVFLYTSMRTFLFSFTISSEGEMVKVGDTKIACTELVRNLADTMRTALIELALCETVTSNQSATIFLDLLRELKEKKSSQNKIKSWLSDHIGWKTGLCLSVALILITVCWFEFDVLATVFSNIQQKFY